MFIEIGAPCTLPLGLAVAEWEGMPTICLMGVTLRHPPTQLFAYPHPVLDVTGARAHMARRHAQRFLSAHGLGPASIEIELATYSHMGLGSDALLGLSTARGLAWVHGLPSGDTLALAQALDLEPRHALEVWGFDQGGFLLVESPLHARGMPKIVRRHAIEAEDKQDDWVFAFFFPRVTDYVSDSLESQRLSTLLNCSSLLDEESLHQETEKIWCALTSDDFEAFAKSLMWVQALNREALARAGTPDTLTHEEQRILDLMRDHGAVAWGRSYSGLGLYGLIRGAQQSIALRQSLRPHIDVHDGILMATITDNQGARHVIREGRVSDYLLPGG
jgi:predicted sugar kinase